MIDSDLSDPRARPSRAVYEDDRCKIRCIDLAICYLLFATLLSPETDWSYLGRNVNVNVSDWRLDGRMSEVMLCHAHLQN